jgi:hypothetical protein
MLKKADDIPQSPWLIEDADGARALIKPKWRPWEKKKYHDQRVIYLALVSLNMPQELNTKRRWLSESSGWVNPNDQILTFRQWCMLNGFSERHGRWLIKTGQGPILTDLGKRHFGIRADDNRRWQDSRKRQP